MEFEKKKKYKECDVVNGVPTALRKPWNQPWSQSTTQNVSR